MIKKTATIIGSGSHCRSIIGILNQTNEYKILEILDTKNKLSKFFNLKSYFNHHLLV